jgi:sugar phosphate permease
MDALYRRIDWRLLPPLMFAYMLAYLDRVNISFAKLQMQQQLGFSESVYGLGAGIFFIGYVLFEVPSNLLLARIGARRTLSRIMILWGATSSAMLFARSTSSFYVLRFLLGVFEAGFGPGMLYYLTLWYCKKRRARVMSYVLLASPVAGIIGGPLSTSIMFGMHGHFGLAGWQWLFLVEGLPCVAMGVFLFFWLDDSPKNAAWLIPAEKQLIAEQVDAAGSATHQRFVTVLKDLRIYVLSLSYFGMIAALYALSFWLPTLLRTAGVTRTLSVGLYSSLPYIAAVVSMLTYARHSDRTGERRRHSAIACLVGATMFAVAASTLHRLYICLPALILAAGAIYAAYTVFWTIPSEYLKGTAAAGGIALINSLGLVGGFVSPLLIGGLKTVTGSLSAGLYVISALLVLAVGLLTFDRVPAFLKAWF